MLFKHHLTLVCFFVLLVTGCKKKDKSVKRSIETGKSVELAREKITVNGGGITIDKPGDPLDKLEIYMPANAYSDDKTFTITSAPITGHSFGEYFNPITPMIIISNKGGYATEYMSVTIPVKVQPGHFAMAFLYNEKTGALEGMNMDYSEPGYITVNTTNFSHTPPGEANPLTAQVGSSIDLAFSQIVVTSVDTSVLMREHFTPFKPGVDDWIFPNHGSYIAPGGHCSGQSIGMLWYYTEKKRRGSPPLYGSFDNNGDFRTPNRWEDDVLAYKFCSTLQNEWAVSETNTEIENWQGKADIRTLRCFSYALRLTNEPQLVHIFTSDNKSAHAMVVYGISEGTLFIADPNKPGSKEPRIHFDTYNMNYSPYFTGRKAGDPGMQYQVIHYVSKTSENAWPKVSEHWDEFMNKTIAKGKFPDYTIETTNEKLELIPLTHGYVPPDGDELMLTINSKIDDVKFKVFNEWGAQLIANGSLYKLPLGEQPIGINVVDSDLHWVGFTWIMVNVKEKKKEQPKVIDGPAPNWGQLLSAVSINGVPQDCDPKHTGWGIDEYRVIKETTTGRTFLQIQINCVGDKSVFVRAAGEFNGVGTYSLDEVTSLIDGPNGKLISGSITVTEWKKSKIRANFEYTVKMVFTDEVRSVKGNVRDYGNGEWEH